jgi:hypothetical protein
MVKLLKAKWTWLLALLIMFGITVGAGAYAQAYGKNEIVHFWVAVPAGNVTETQVLRGAGPPITLTPINIDLDARGVLKNFLQPNVEALSTHWIYNLGQKPVKIHMELTDCTIPVDWEVSANFPYDPETNTFTSPLTPGNSVQNLGIDWVFTLPPREEAMADGDGLVYDGGLLLTNADTGERLTFIPIRIGYGGVENFEGGYSCCG